MFHLIPRKECSGNDPAVVRPSFGRELEQFRNEFNSLWSRFWGEMPAFSHHWGDWPADNGWGVDVDDKENEMVVHCEAPGFEVGDFDVHVTAEHLVIKAEHKEEKQEGENAGYHFGSLERMIPIPHGIVADEIDAHYKNGVLEVHLPKSAEAKGKQIDVRAN